MPAACICIHVGIRWRCPSSWRASPLIFLLRISISWRRRFWWYLTAHWISMMMIVHVRYGIATATARRSHPEWRSRLMQFGFACAPAHVGYRS